MAPPYQFVQCLSGLTLDSMVYIFGSYKTYRTKEIGMEIMLLRAEEVAKALGVGRSKAYEMMASGEVPVVRIGRSVRVPAESLRRWISDRVESEGEGA